MKKLIIGFFSFLLISKAGAQSYKSYPGDLTGKKITSDIEYSVSSPKQGVQSPITNGGMTITVNNGQSLNNVYRELNFSDLKGAVLASRQFKRIKSISKVASMELMVDTDNPFERPNGMEKMGERYDMLVKDKAVANIQNGAASKVSGTAAFEDYWNQFTPYLGMDSALNFIVLGLPKAVDVKPGVQWIDSSSNESVIIENQFNIKSMDGDWIVVECSGINKFIPNTSLGQTGNVNLRIQRLNSKYTGTLTVNRITGFVKEANFTATTLNRKYVLGEKIDSEKSETVKVVNQML